MSITGELRSWAEGNALCAGMSLRTARDQAIAIADRIDAEHELEVAEAHAKGIYEGFAADKGPRDFVELPKDADGEYIHIGDVMEWARIEDDDLTIVREVSAVGNGVFFAWSDEQRRYAQYESRAYRHHHTPTVEDVLREFADAMSETHPMDVPARISEYAKRLQLAGDAS